MPILMLSELQPGMKLGRPVLSPQGTMLANAADELTPKHIRLFKMWGVTEAEVEGSHTAAQETSPVFTPADEPADSIDELFVRHLGNPVMYQIATFAKELLLQRK
ncbi:MAG: hypothetical protein ACYDAG_13935 [Chloroflexota bacterium]